jgi:hypothetical protein
VLAQKTPHNLKEKKKGEKKKEREKEKKRVENKPISRTQADCPVIVICQTIRSFSPATKSPHGWSTYPIPMLH